jgi:hypothetical protein
MADDTEGTGAGESSTKPRRSAAKRGAKRSSSSRARKSAKQRRAPLQEDLAGKEPVHAEASDRTQPGGVYYKNDGRVVDANGNDLDPDTYETLDEEALEDAREQRIAELDALADQED